MTDYEKVKALFEEIGISCDASTIFSKEQCVVDSIRHFAKIDISQVGYIIDLNDVDDYWAYMLFDFGGKYIKTVIIEV